jgi:hypothetical protein
MNEQAFFQQAIAFAHEFVKREHKLWQDAYGSADNERFWNDREVFNHEFFIDGLVTDALRPKNPDKDWLEQASAYIDVIQERIIFQAKLYDLPKIGLAAGIYLSSNHRGDEDYFELILVSIVNKNFKIVTSCLTDLEGFFHYHDGLEFDELPAPIQVAKFRAPKDPKNLEEYNAE